MSATDHEMQDLVEVLNGTRDDKSRLRFLKAWLSDHKLTCAQSKPIFASLFGLGDVGSQAALLIYPQLTDPENFKDSVLPEAFQYADERAEVAQKLGL